MARKIIWSERAALDKDKILYYWLDRNHSKSYPIKLNKLFHQAAKLLSQRPLIGRRTSVDGVRSGGKMNPADSPFQL